MKRWLSFVAIVVLALALVVGAACGGEGEEDEEGVTEIKLGVGLPMIGAYGAVVGLPAKNSFGMAAEDIGVFTVGGKEYRWKLIFEDNAATIAGGAASATKLIFDRDVDFMHQSTASPGLAAEPICREKGMILNVSGAAPKEFGPDKPLFFQTSSTWEMSMTPLFDWLSKEHPEVKRISIAVPDDHTGEAIVDACRPPADYYGFVILPEYVPVLTTEYFPVATRIMSKDPDLFIAAGFRVHDLLWAMGYEGLSATWEWIPGEGKDLGWDKLKGCLIFTPTPKGGLWPKIEALGVEYEDRYGVEFGRIELLGINTLYVFTDLLRKAGTVDDMDKIIETMESGVGFDSLVGPIRFGGEVLNGIGHLGIWPAPVYEVVGEDEFRVICNYSPDEVEAIVNEVFK